MTKNEIAIKKMAKKHALIACSYYDEVRQLTNSFGGIGTFILTAAWVLSISQIPEIQKLLGDIDND